MASFAGSQRMPMASACRQRERRSRERPGFGHQYLNRRLAAGTTVAVQSGSQSALSAIARATAVR